MRGDAAIGGGAEHDRALEWTASAREDPNLGHPSAAGCVAPHVEDGVEGAGSLGRDGTLPHTRECPERRKPRGHVPRPIRVDGRPAPVMPRVESRQDVANFGTTTFPEDEAVGAHAHGRAHEVREGDASSSFDVWLAFDEVDAVWVGGRDLGDLLDADDAFAGGDEGEGGAQEGGLATAGRPTHEDVRPRGNERPQEHPHRAGQCPAGLEVCDAQPTGAEGAQGDEGPRS